VWPLETAVSEGHRKFQAIAVAAPICEIPSVRINLLSELLPHAFKL